MPDLFDPQFHPFDFTVDTGRSTLVIGIGGGCDIITACALARSIFFRRNDGGMVVYANTKRSAPRTLTEISRHVFRVPPEVYHNPNQRRWTGTLIDQAMPRGDDGCPLIFTCPRNENDHADFASEIAELGFDRIVAVDTGGDVLSPNARSGDTGRDRQMLRVLARTKIPSILAVVGPGCDGETSAEELERCVRREAEQGGYLGAFSLQPLMNDLMTLSDPVGRTRTPRIILEAMNHPPHELFRVPRHARPEIPSRWLRVGLCFRIG
jgi:hypothetical protein